MSNIKEISDATFKEEVLDSSKVTVVDFFATWCGPCQKLSLILDTIQTELGDKISIFKMDVDQNTEVAKGQSIVSLPTILIYKDGEAKERLIGLLPKSKIIETIEKYL